MAEAPSFDRLVEQLRDAEILAQELDARADVLETFARTGTRHPSYKGGVEELGLRVRILRREAGRLRGKA